MAGTLIPAVVITTTKEATWLSARKIPKSETQPEREDAAPEPADGFFQPTMEATSKAAKGSKGWSLGSNVYFKQMEVKERGCGLHLGRRLVACP